MTRSTLRSLATTTLLLLSSRSSMAQVQRGAIRGIVSDVNGRPLAGAQVAVKNTDIRATTGLDGKYQLAGVWPGETEVRAQRIGFELQTQTISVKPADTATANFSMPSVAVLPGVDATAAGRITRFEERRTRGGGVFITHADIEKRHPNALSDMLRNVSGVSIRSGTTGTSTVVEIERSSHSIANGACEVQLYVDGLPYPRGNIDDFPPETVEGLEIYRGGANLPAEFSAKNSGCGLIAIWTRDPTAIPRKP